MSVTLYFSGKEKAENSCVRKVRGIYKRRAFPKREIGRIIQPQNIPAIEIILRFQSDAMMILTLKSGPAVFPQMAEFGI